MDFNRYVSEFWDCYLNRFRTLWFYGEPTEEKQRLMKAMVDTVPDSICYNFDEGFDKFAEMTGADQTKEDWIIDAIVKFAEGHSMVVLVSFGAVVSHFWQGKLWKVLDIQSKLFSKPVLLVLESRNRLQMQPLMSNMVFNGRHNCRLGIDPPSPYYRPTCGNPLDTIYETVVSGEYEWWGRWEYKKIDRNPFASENIIRLALTKDSEIKSRILDRIGDKYRKDELHTQILDAIANGRKLPEGSGKELPILEYYRLVEREGDHWRCVSPHVEFFFRIAYHFDLGDTPEYRVAFYRANIEPMLPSYFEDACRRVFPTDGPSDFNITEKPYDVKRLNRFMAGREGQATLYSAYGFSRNVEKRLEESGLKFETGKNIFGFDFIKIG